MCVQALSPLALAAEAKAVKRLSMMLGEVIEYSPHLIEYRPLLTGYRALLIECRALYPRRKRLAMMLVGVMKYGFLLMEYIALWVECFLI